MVAHRSVSQLTQYDRCPYSYYLSRIAQVWERPATWSPKGLGVHEAAEAFERSGRTMSLDEMQDRFSESYTKHINRLCQDTPNFEFWFPSGPYRAGQAYTGRNGRYYLSDIERQHRDGLEQVERYRWYYTDTAPLEQIWTTPDGTPAIELGFSLDLDGVPVRGFIDQVIEHPEHGPYVRDIKSGRSPGDDFQLGVYAVALEAEYEISVPLGDYWMGRLGRPTAEPYKLSYWTRERITEEFHRIDSLIQREEFPADPDEQKCATCAVATSCEFKI
ncbi:PD-(D/E)XK nuclease family protein [Actinopolyspora erythraea]|uniref:PD-(D/E)XK nuclease family protein n=1 Tax=Actinopolyspora erythraea TaxID=414996 RepID=A0A099D8F6_9ACTN|nr:PD-(D/E)XK nuclease family protein [Actinopolyspora erythraea]ASU78502.1 PD-(D/E)XK nuclease family protein [Actinopolyspora erythraea]KGI82057.1 hypothetical protein IL38_06965 [Actinopolyspora erythraea]